MQAPLRGGVHLGFNLLQGFENQRLLIGEAPINGGLADSGTLGHHFDAKPLDANLDQ
ncbi:hypothetical protein D3C81_1767490 [compost metagenome]